MSAKLHNLISHYDCIGWIPTIRGCLSLDLIDNAGSILGDVDKYSIRFKTISGFHSQHYLIASALLTVNDTKAGMKYDRTFRYVFTGSINDDEITKNFLADNNLLDDEPLNDYIKKEGLLLGHLFMVFENDLTDQEATFLKGLKKLSKSNKDYLEAFNVKADSMEVLNGYRAGMLKEWGLLTEMACKIETDEKNKRPTFSFDVALTRDGILLLKNATNTEFKNYFAAPGTADDYTQNIPVHRLFKIAMNCIKYLFHSNYHHNEEHDTYLPASNLHPAKESGTLDLYRVFRHQLDAFFVPVIKLKRSAFSNHTVESYGVLLYAKAFIRVFRANKLVSSEETKKAKDYCEILEKEVTEMTASQRTLFNALITRHNPFIIMSGLLAFVFTCLKLLTVFVEIPFVIKINEFAHLTVQNEMQLFINLGLVAILTAIGYAIYIIPRSRILSKQFKPKQKSKKWLFYNSCLWWKGFSLPYKIYIIYNTVKLQIKDSVYVVMVTIFYLFCMLVALYSLLNLVR
jgi:hypothetical protein